MIPTVRILLMTRSRFPSGLFPIIKRPFGGGVGSSRFSTGIAPPLLEHVLTFFLMRTSFFVNTVLLPPRTLCPFQRAQRGFLFLIRQPFCVPSFNRLSFLAEIECVLLMAVSSDEETLVFFRTFPPHLGPTSGDASPPFPTGVFSCVGPQKIRLSLNRFFDDPLESSFFDPRNMDSDRTSRISRLSDPQPRPYLGFSARVPSFFLNASVAL